MRKIDICIACFNEEENIPELVSRISKVCESLPTYNFEFLFIDNCSSDGTVEVLRSLAKHDRRIKVIVNSRNFGPVRSSTHLLKQSTGDCVIGLVADLQDPPELVPEFIEKWEKGFKIVIGVKKGSEENGSMFFLRSAYYNLIGALSEVPLAKQFTGFCLLDKKLVDTLREIDDPYPYFRGLICDLGFERGVVEFVQPLRKHGKTKNNFYSLYDMAMLGITNHSKIPLRVATFSGFCLAVLSMIVACGYFFYKLMFWNSFQLGSAPAIVGLFFFASIQMCFIGILGEYIGAIHTQVLKRPLVVEKERINFD